MQTQPTVDQLRPWLIDESWYTACRYDSSGYAIGAEPSPGGTKVKPTQIRDYQSSVKLSADASVLFIWRPRVGFIAVTVPTGKTGYIYIRWNTTTPWLQLRNLKTTDIKVLGYGWWATEMSASSLSPIVEASADVRVTDGRFEIMTLRDYQHSCDASRGYVP